MSTAAYTYDKPNVDLYELQTLHRGSTLSGRLEANWNNEKMAGNNKREKKTSLTFKERLFGHKKGRKGGNYGM